MFTDQRCNLHDNSFRLCTEIVRIVAQYGNCTVGHQGFSNETNQNGNAHRDDNPDRGNSTGGLDFSAVLNCHESQQNMRHSEIAKSPSQGGTDGQNVVRLCGIGCNIIGVVERKIARQSLCIFHDNVNTASLDNSKDNYHDQCNGHNNALEQVGCAGSQKSADAGIGNDDYST